MAGRGSIDREMGGAGQDWRVRRVKRERGQGQKRIISENVQGEERMAGEEDVYRRGRWIDEVDGLEWKAMIGVEWRTDGRNVR